MSARTVENRWGDRLTVGMPVIVRHARGDANTLAVITAFITSGVYAKAYGKHARLDSGGIAAIDDLSPRPVSRNPRRTVSTFLADHAKSIGKRAAKAVGRRVHAAAARKLESLHSRYLVNPAKRGIEIVALPQSTGKTLYGVHVGGYVVAHGYKTKAAAMHDALKWRASHKNPRKAHRFARRNPGRSKLHSGTHLGHDYIELTGVKSGKVRLRVSTKYTTMAEIKAIAKVISARHKEAISARRIKV